MFCTVPARKLTNSPSMIKSSTCLKLSMGRKVLTLLCAYVNLICLLSFHNIFFSTWFYINVFSFHATYVVIGNTNNKHRTDKLESTKLD